MAVVGHTPREAPFLLIGPMIDQAIGRLESAEPMIIELVEVIDALEFMRRIRFVIAAVVKALAVLGPGCAGRLDPLDLVGQIQSTLNLTHLPFLPIGARGGEPVGHQLSIIADRVAAQGDCPIGGKLVRIEEDLRLFAERLQSVKHGLILQPVVFVEKVAATLFMRNTVALVVP